MIKSPKAKGSGGEREAAALLKIWAAGVGVFIEPERNLEQVRGGGFDLNGVPGLAIEVKRVETPNVSGWWKQTVRQAVAAEMHPFLMHRQNRKPWRFRIRMNSALQIDDRWALVQIDADLDLNHAKNWFQEYVKLLQK